MPQLNINQATLSDQENKVEVFSGDLLQVDTESNQKETRWMNTKWAEQWWYFNNVPDLKSAIIMKAVWNVGLGYTTDPATEVILDHISGWGKDTFDDVLFHMEIVKRIGGDSYAEIIKEGDTIINLKPLDTGKMVIVTDDKGRLLRYEQMSAKGDGSIQKFQPEEILHFCNDRLAGQIHGISVIDALKSTIDADEENFGDVRKVMKRQAKPIIMFKLGTDKQSEIDAFVAKMDKATNKGENIYIPDDENSVSYEVIQTQVSDLILSWRDDMRNKFYRTIMLPQIVPGAGGQSTESESKVIYAVHEVIVRKEQRWIEKQIWNQLFMRIKLIAPPSMMPNLQQDVSKDGSMMPQPSDVQAGVGR